MEKHVDIIHVTDEKFLTAIGARKITGVTGKIIQWRGMDEIYHRVDMSPLDLLDFLTSKMGCIVVGMSQHEYFYSWTLRREDVPPTYGAAAAPEKSSK